jgi:hypothetical protein
MVFDIVLIAVGFGFIAMALFTKDDYVSRNPSVKPVPRWLARSVYSFAAVLCWTFGFLLLFGFTLHKN